MFLKKFLKRFLFLSLAGVILIGVILLLSKYEIDRNTSERMYQQTENLPERKVGLVLGCSKFARGGQLNQYFINRIKAAHELYSLGKVQFLLVSGDNAQKSYNEPSVMKRDLVALGVPAGKIYCDYAGFRTLDSVVRAKEVFGQDDFIVISQEFHARRAIFIGLAHDLDLLGFAAQPVMGMGSFRTEARECLARMRAILDVWILDQKPKFLGKTIPIE